MKICSQLLDDVEPLGARTDKRVWRARDRLGGQAVVRKRFQLQNDRAFLEWRQHLALTRALADSGFLGAEDVIPSGDTEFDVTWRYAKICPITTVVQTGGSGALLDVLRQISLSLEFLHALGYLHVDLKPANILIEPSGDGFVTSVSDLEFALRIGTQLATVQQGTEEFMSPEMLAGQTLTEASDVFSFGRTVEAYLRASGAGGECAGVRQLAECCVKERPTDRPETFGEVSRRLAALAVHQPSGGAIVPPLHPDVFRGRVERLRRAIMNQDVTRVGLHLLRAPLGGGKSRILRDVCLAQQIAGVSTVRFTDVGGYAELAGALDGIAEAYAEGGRSPRGYPPVIFAETAHGCRAAAGELRELDRKARDLGLTIVAECRAAADCALPASIIQVPLAPLRPRECVAATSPLALSPDIVPANGLALSEATGGNPRLMQLFMRRDRRINQARSLADPVAVDAVDPAIAAYWQARLDTLSAPARSLLNWAAAFHYDVPRPLLLRVAGHSDNERLLETLIASGILARIGGRPSGESLAFCYRSARNVIRLALGHGRLREMCRRILEEEARPDHGGGLRPVDRWGLECLVHRPFDADRLETLRGQSGNVHDLKLVLWTMLAHFRRRRRLDPHRQAWLAVDITDGFSAIGSTRRQRRWAERALEGLSAHPAGDRSPLDILRATSRMYEAAGRTEARTAWLEGSLDLAYEGLERSYLLSELSAVYIMSYRLRDAAERASEAHALMEQADVAQDSEVYVRNLNRLGLSRTLSGRHRSAEKYLNQCLALAKRQGYDHITWRCVGNLGYVYRAIGNATKAYQCARGVSNYYRHAGELMAYVRGLRDQVLCLVELGRIGRALQLARLTIERVLLTGDLYEWAWALNNLGWVLSLRGEATEAHQTLRNVIARHQRDDAPVLAANSQNNLAWLYLTAQESGRARERSQTALQLVRSEEPGTLTIRLEAHRVLALADIQDDDFESASRHVNEAARLAVEDGSPKRLAEAALVELELTLWRGDDRAARSLLDKLATNPAVSGVHPVRLDYERCRGHWLTLCGQYEDAHAVLSRAAQESRLADRYDKHIDAVVMLSRLSQRMRNYHMAIRFADIAAGMIKRVREAIDDDAQNR